MYSEEKIFKDKIIAQIDIHYIQTQVIYNNYRIYRCKKPFVFNANDKYNSSSESFQSFNVQCVINELFIINFSVI